MLLVFLLILIQVRVSIQIVKESQPLFTDGGTSKLDAELAHFTRRFGFVNSDYVTDTWIIEQFNEISADHEVTLRLYTPKKWNDLELKTRNVGKKICQNSLNDPTFKENRITFDSREADSIQIIRKNVVFRYYKKRPMSVILALCPIKIQGRGGFFVYTTPFEEIPNEEEEYYFALTDLFYEDITEGTDEIVVKMGTKLTESKSLLPEPLEKMLNKALNIVT